MKKTLYKLLPTALIYRLLELRETLRGTRSCYYSQFGEDLIVSFLTRSKKRGFYVDVGANHPKRGSNTYLLYKAGWRGIAIEPDPYLFSLLRRYRAGDTVLQIGVGEQEGEMTYYRFADSHMSTFSEERVSELIHKGLKLVEKKQIPIRPLRHILASGVHIDVLSVDVEGLDLEVLRSNDWESVQPDIVVVESIEFNAEKPESDPVYSFLHKKGYRLYSRAGYSLIFTKKKF